MNRDFGHLAVRILCIGAFPIVSLVIGACASDEKEASDGGIDDAGADAGTDTDTDTDTDADTDAGADAGETELLVLDSILDVNGTVTTKGMDVTSDGAAIFLWNYNQDQLELWDGTQLTTFVDPDLVSGYGTDLAVDWEGNVYVTQGGSSTGERIMKWNGQTGAPMWGEAGVSISGALLLGAGKGPSGGGDYIYVGDGGGTSTRILKLSAADGSIAGEVPVSGMPLDVAVDADGNAFVLSSAVSNPLFTGDPTILRKLDPEGVQIGADVQLDSAIYLALGSDGRLYISCSDFDLDARRILVYDAALSPLGEVDLPIEYSGYSGEIATYGSGDGMRVLISAQAGTGSGPACDVLVYKKPL